MLEVGKKYQVKADHKFHPNRIGVFEFMGGPDHDVVVLYDPNTSSGTMKSYFAVKESDLTILPSKSAMKGKLWTRIYNYAAAVRDAEMSKTSKVSETHESLKSYLDFVMETL